jgi:hypothetical protein
MIADIYDEGLQSWPQASSLEPQASSYLQAAAPESAWYLYLQLNPLRAGTVDVINEDESVNNSRSDVNT